MLPCSEFPDAVALPVCWAPRPRSSRRPLWRRKSPRAPVRDPHHTFERYAWSWRELQRRNVVMQAYDYSCGAAAVATVLQYYWEDSVTEKQILDAMLEDPDRRRS